ncbi:MAG: terminase large subunit domain-containing protein [Anaerolineae bacterium]
MAWQGKRIWWLAPTYQMASQVWRDLKATMRDVPAIHIRESEKRLSLPTGGVIEIRSTHYPDHLRGAGLDYAVLDEAAYMHPSVWAEVVRPMLLERRGGALFLSTPRGKNWFWQIYQLGLDPLEPQWRSFHFPSSVNPLIAQDELQQIRRTTAERTFREEYEAEFLDDSGAVFRRVQESASAPPNPRYIAGHRYIMGVDWGKEHDFTVLVVIDSTTGQMVALDRFNQIDYRFQRGRLSLLAQRWHPSVIWAEANSIGAPIIEQLRADGLPVQAFMTTARSKAPLIEGLALAIEQGALALLPDETLLGELASYEIERSASGHYRYSAPSGMHDDTVMATALAWHGCGSPSVQIDFA